MRGGAQPERRQQRIDRTAVYFRDLRAAFIRASLDHGPGGVEALPFQCGSAQEGCAARRIAQPGCHRGRIGLPPYRLELVHALAACHEMDLIARRKVRPFSVEQANAHRMLPIGDARPETVVRPIARQRRSLRARHHDDRGQPQSMRYGQPLGGSHLLGEAIQGHRPPISRSAARPCHAKERWQPEVQPIGIIARRAGDGACISGEVTAGRHVAATCLCSEAVARRARRSRSTNSTGLFWPASQSRNISASTSSRSGRSDSGVSPLATDSASTSAPPAPTAARSRCSTTTATGSWRAGRRM
jgi:hypothetical protein